MTSLNRIIATHIICWLLFILFEIISGFVAVKSFYHLINYIVFYTINISFFYCHIVLLNRQFVRTRPSYVRIIFFVILEIGLYLGIKVFFDYWLWPVQFVPINKFDTFGKFALLDLFRCLYFMGLATLYWTSRNIGRFRQKAVKAEMQRLSSDRDKAMIEADLSKSQNAYLKQQLNPHLLFNTLNFIYSNVFKYSETAADSVLLLADIMRFSLETTGEDGKIDLADELAALNQLIDLNRLQFDYPLNMKVNISGNFSGKRIIPLALLTLTENLFKHGDLRKGSEPAALTITALEDDLLFFGCKIVNERLDKKSTLPA